MEERKQDSIREFSAGGVVYKKDNKKILWLVAKSTPSKAYPKSVWRLPKGWLDDENQNPGSLARGAKKASEIQVQETALREVEEEGGVKAKIIAKIITERYFYKLKGKNILKFVTFYLMEYQKDTKEGFSFETEKVEWLEYKQAMDKLTHRGEKEVLKLAKIKLEEGR